MRGRRSHTERGFALVVTLGFTVILAFMALAMSSGAQLSGAAFRNNAEIMRARSVAEAAVELAKIDLSRASDQRILRLDGSPHSFTIDGATATVAINDERAKLDLNQQPVEHLAGLIRQVRGSGGNGLSPEGLAAEIRRANLSNVTGLLGLPGVTQPLFEALEPHVTVLGYGTRINVMHAQDPVLRSLSGMTPALMRELQLARERGARRPGLGGAEPFATNESGPAYTITGIGRTARGIETRITTLVVTTGAGFTSNRVGVRVVEQR